MDLNTLLTIGKVTRKLEIKGFGVLHLETPSISRIKEGQTYDNLAEHIVRIDNEKGENEDFSSPEKKQALKTILESLQIGMFAHIASVCEEINKEQAEVIGDLFSKK